MREWMDSASRTVFTIVGAEADKSRGSHLTFVPVRRWEDFEGLREVAITKCPRLRAYFARARPRPEEEPVISQTGGDGEDIVVVVEC